MLANRTNTTHCPYIGVLVGTPWYSRHKEHLKNIMFIGNDIILSDG